MTDKLPLPELLSPAGSEESLRAALAGGADAVYFGHSAFSNRMRAKNFTDDTIRDAIKLCHDCGAAAHITVNTRVRDRENDEILRLLEILLGGEADSRADAIIVADLGIARLIKERYPHALLPQVYMLDEARSFPNTMQVNNIYLFHHLQGNLTFPVQNYHN